MPRNFVVGRDLNSDIKVPSYENTVSGIHLELLVLEDPNQVFVTDCNSTNGTYVLREGRGTPEQIQKGYVGWNDKLILGKYQVSVKELLESRFQNGTPERNPYTGEIIWR